MSDLLRVNGNVVGWGSLKFKVNGLRYTGFTSIGYGEKLESQLVYGMGRHQAPRGGTAGKYTPDMVKAKGPIASVLALKQQVAALSPTGRSYGAARFSGVLFFYEPGGVGQAGESHLVEFAGLKWSESTMANEEGPDPSQQEFSLQCLAIREDGMMLFDDSEGSPF
jgi:hypothetical protein